MTSSDTPDLSSPVAWLWRNTCAPREAEVVTSARSSAPCDAAVGPRARERPVRRLRAEKHGLLANLRPHRRDVGEEGVADILGQRQLRPVAGLSRDPQQSPVPVDVAQAQGHDVTGPQRQSRQQQEDRSVA